MSEPSPRGHRLQKRGPLILVLAVVLWFGWFIGRGSHVYNAIACDSATPDVDVVMLSASWCGYCRRARAYLHENNIRHCEFDIEHTAVGRKRFDAQPLKVIPVIEVGGRDTLIGFNPTELEQSLLAHNLIDPARTDW